jgi:Ca-activated chloride channel family protein
MSIDASTRSREVSEMRLHLRTILSAAAVVALLVVSLQGQQPPQPPAGNGGSGQESFRFRSGVELINVTATVTDASGRFVSGLRQDDFIVYEDDARQDVTHFSADRVPVSLGVVLDTSSSMAGEKIEAARSALDRFLYDLLDRQDEIFLYQFSNDPTLLQTWTSDRQLLSRALNRLVAHGGTAMYDAVAEAIPLAQRGQFRKKALVVISDGNDTSSTTRLKDVQQLIRESETLVYAIGIDCGGDQVRRRSGIFEQRRGPFPIPFPFPPGGRGGWPRPQAPQPPDRRGWTSPCSEPVNVAALRDLTDDSGGRTEIIRDARDLNPATTNIADELSKQYYLGYPSDGKKDGRWHAIRVEVRNRNYRVRARRGYVAS